MSQTNSDSDVEVSDGRKNCFRRWCCCCCCKSKNKPNATENREETPILEDIIEEQQIPFSGELPERLSSGLAILITGVPLANCLRFGIDLICRKTENTDIGFHFNPRFEQRYVVRNSYINGRWGEEETVTARNFAFERGKKFELVIFVGPHQFLVAVDKKHYCAFTYRLPVSSLHCIEINGLVDVLEVHYKHTQLYPAEKIECNVIPITKFGDKKEILCSGHEELEVPYTGTLSEKLSVGWQIEIYGRVKILPHAFYINLQESAYVYPHPIIPLHLNPRFSTLCGNNVFVRNSWFGEWGREEAAPGFPFIPGGDFTLVVQCGSNFFSVWVNNKLSGEFRYRESAEKINTVYIQGDVVIKRVVMSQKS